ncbi:MAG: Ig-like domain-containing protein, partial [Candidatus Acidiferrales bacterium]
STKSASASVTLTSNILVSASTLSGATASVRAVDRRETICAVISGTMNPNPLLEWRVNGILNGNTAEGQIVSSPALPSMCPQPGIAGAFLFTMDYVAPGAMPATNPVTVNISSVADTSKSADVQITIVSAVTVTVAPASITVAPGASQQFTATVTGTLDTSVTWSVAGSGCGGMACGTISMSGLYTVMPTATAMASDTVTATSHDGGANASATVTIAGPAPVISGLAPASASAGAASSFLLRVLGVNFATGAEIFVNGVSRVTSCLSATECTATLAPADASSAGSVSIQIRNSGSQLEHSNTVPFEAIAPVASEEVIPLDAAAPSAMGKDIAVVDIVAVANVENNVAALGLFIGSSSCSPSGGPVTIARPASGSQAFALCIVGVDAMQTFTLSGPASPDITIISVQPFLPGFVPVQLKLNVPSTAHPGLRTLFVRDSNGNTTAVAGGIVVK